jgi:hypothetical protein
MVVSLGGGVRVTPDTQGPLEDLAVNTGNGSESDFIVQGTTGYPAGGVSPAIMTVRDAATR